MEISAQPGLSFPRRLAETVKPLRHRIEYAAVVLFLWVVERSPLHVADRVARVLATLAFASLRGRRRVAIDNIRRSGVVANRREAVRVAAASFRHLMTVVLETLRAPPYLRGDMGSDWLETRFENGADESLLKPGRPALLLSAHLGNWELCAKLCAQQRTVHAIARKMNNPLVEALMARRTEGAMIKIIPKHTPNPLSIVRPIRDGGALVILFDQHAGNNSAILNVLGRPAAVHTSPALIHLLTGAPLYFTSCIRTGPMRYTWTLRRIEPEGLNGERENDVRAIMTCANNRLETLIRQYPEQYLWMHRRWKVAAQSIETTP